MSRHGVAVGLRLTPVEGQGQVRERRGQVVDGAFLVGSQPLADPVGARVGEGGASAKVVVVEVERRDDARLSGHGLDAVHPLVAGLEGDLDHQGPGGLEVAVRASDGVHGQVVAGHVGADEPSEGAQRRGVEDGAGGVGHHVPLGEPRGGRLGVLRHRLVPVGLGLLPLGVHRILEYHSAFYTAQPGTYFGCYCVYYHLSWNAMETYAFHLHGSKYAAR